MGDWNKKRQERGIKIKKYMEKCTQIVEKARTLTHTYNFHLHKLFILTQFFLDSFTFFIGVFVAFLCFISPVNIQIDRYRRMGN
jgi:hypothetical protein